MTEIIEMYLCIVKRRKGKAKFASQILFYITSKEQKTISRLITWNQLLSEYLTYNTDGL